MSTLQDRLGPEPTDPVALMEELGCPAWSVASLVQAVGFLSFPQNGGVPLMAYGLGSIKEDPRTGRWKARYYGPDGRQRCKTFPNKTEARKFLSTVQADKLRGQWIDPRGAQTPFGEWADQWLRGKHNLTPHTHENYEIVLRCHVLPTFGKKPIGKITALDVKAWMNSLVDQGLAPATIRPCWRIFGSVMRSAIAAKLILEAPIGRGIVDLPKVERKRERFLTEAELERLVAEIPDFYKPLIYTAAYTGCRWQELAGLKRPRLDLDKGQLHVRAVFKRVRGSVIFVEHPKSDAGRRTVTLPRRLVTILRDHLDHAPKSEFVFTGRKGGILRESNFRRVWNPALAKLVAQLPAERAEVLSGLTFHDLRHTHASWLIRDNVQPLAMQRRLGHKDIRTTMNVYGHLFPNHEDALVEVLDQRWKAATEGAESGVAKILSLPA